MSMAEKNVLKREESYVQQVAELGLSWPLFMDAAMDGRAAYQEHTALDAPAARGIETHSKIVKNISEKIKRGKLVGFSRVSGNQVTFLSDDIQEPLQFIVSSGDKHTGKIDGVEPSTLSNKGPETESKIRANQALLGVQEYLGIFDLSFESPELQPSNKLYTWIFLYFIAPNGSIQCELSLPADCEVKYSKKCMITQWAQRIIFPLIPPLGEVENIIQSPDSTMYDVNIKRKQK